MLPIKVVDETGRKRRDMRPESERKERSEGIESE